VVHEKKIFKYLSIFSHIAPQGSVPLFKQILISKSYCCFLPSLVKIGSLVLEKKMFS